MSVASDGTQSNLWASSENPSVSADGRFVAFHSEANNLVSDHTGNNDDVFVHDRQTGKTTIVSVSSNGVSGNGNSGYASISADGRFVAFRSFATNLVPIDGNLEADIFVHDRQTGQTERVSVSSNGVPGNGDSEIVAISGDGRFVAFVSRANNLVSDDTNDAFDVFVRDRQTRETIRVSVASDGTQGNHFSNGVDISTDGRFVAFTSYASNLVDGDTNDADDIFIYDLETGETTAVSVTNDTRNLGEGGAYLPTLSADGRYVAFSSSARDLVGGDTNNVVDVFVHDRTSQ